MTTKQTLHLIYNHVLKLSNNNSTLAQARTKELIAIAGNKIRPLKKLCTYQSRNFVEMSELLKKLI